MVWRDATDMTVGDVLVVDVDVISNDFNADGGITRKWLAIMLLLLVDLTQFRHLVEVMVK